MSKKEYGLAIGQRGSNSGDPISEIIRRNMAESEEKKRKRDDEIDELQHEAKVKELKGDGKEPAAITFKPVEIDVNEGKKEATARAQAAEAQVAAERDKRLEIQEKLEQERMANLRSDFTKQLDDLKKLLGEGGASKQSITEKIAEVKSNAEELGYGPKQAGGTPPEIQIQLQQMQTDLQLRLAQMEDDRNARNKEWELTLKKYGDDKELQQQRLAQEASANAERTQLMRGGLDTLGRIMGKAMVDPGSAPSGGISSSRVAKDYPLEAEEGETGQFSCPGCGRELFLAPDAGRVQCASCGAMSNFTRIPKAETPISEEVKSEFTPAI
ncbi:hypothetical protein KKH23_10170 [Patescibacteria group bacterium]|nr:hypothetical protein [Patescibacteria group bacterium]